MAATGGSSASATQYDVFLSFRGPDTRNTFTDCLYRTMVGQGIAAYRDSEELHAGDRIDDLLRAVGNSKICIPILSTGYASSAWCLHELARVTELHESTGKPEILPIFFDVTPTDVKLRTGLYLKDLEKHEQRHGAEMRQRWEAALRKVAEIKGWEVQGKAYGEVIELVVREVLLKLKVKQRNLESKLVGVDEQVEAIMELLDIDSNSGVRFVGIHGMGGIGKTTLAKIVFNELCPRFDGQCSFIGNIRESSNRYGLVDLQKQLASDIFGSRFVENFIDTEEGIDSIRRRAGSKKVLIVLDDLDEKEQLKDLVGGPNTFGSGSRILITTRHKRILDEEEEILAYEVKVMDLDKALELFTWHAFKSFSPPDTHQSLSREVISTTGGLPLALEVIGSSLRHKDIRIWREMLERLKKAPHNTVQDKLKISYDALEDVKKEIFLDIACFFIEEKKSWAAYFWEACGLFPHMALDELIDLCLIKIINGDDIWMHDQLRDLGRDIVRQECTRNLTGRSRLWNDKEALEVVRWKQRKDNVQALNLGGYHSDPITVMDEELEKMPNLKFLRLYAVTFAGDFNIYLQELRWLSWDSPPLDCKTANLHLKNLVVFILSNNENTEDWGGWIILKMTNKLKVLSLSTCRGLKWTPDFSGCLSLEILSLDQCPNLQEVDSSIGKLKGLTHLQLHQCRSLRNLPKEIGGLVNMKHFSISWCDSLQNLPKEIGGLVNMKHFSIRCCNSLQNLPKEIGGLVNMEHFSINLCRSLRNLPKEIGGLVNLKHFSIWRCLKIKKLPDIRKLASLSKLNISQTNITSLPDSIGNAKNLSSLDLSSTPIAKLPISIGELTQLEFLSLSSCENFLKLPESIGNLTTLQNLDLSRTKIVELPDSIKNLKQLKMMRMASCPIQRLPAGIGMLEGMKELNVQNCQQLAGELPIAIGKLLSPSILDISQTRVCAVPVTMNSLIHLQELDLSFCNEFQELPKLPSSLNCLRVKSTSLRLVPDLSYLTNLVTLELSNNSGQALAHASTLQLQWVGKLSKLEELELCLSNLPVPSTELGCLPRLKKLTLSRMDSFDSVAVGPQFLHLKNLSTLHLCHCPQREIQLDGLELLGDLTVTYCEFLKGLSVISSSLKKLSRMEVSNCPELLQIRFLSTMESLECLRVMDCKSLGGLYGLSNSKKLKTLYFFSCPVLRVIEGLEELELLQCLEFFTCPSLKVLTNLSNSKIPNECRVAVWDCEKLPDFFLGRYGDYREEILDWTRRGLNQEGAARFFERGQPLIVQMLNKLEVPYDTLTKYYGISVTLKWTGYLSLETLYFHYCLNLRKFDSSIGKMKVLTRLDIIRCTNLRTLPEEIGGLANLTHFSIKKCSQMEKLPHSIGKLVSLSKLDISSSRITSFPNSIGNAKHLSFLNLSGTPIVELPISIGELTRLEFLSLKDCRNLGELPESLGNLTSLQKLNLSRTNIVELPNSIKNLKQLKVMRMGFSPIRRLPASIEMLEKLEELYAEHCEQFAGELQTQIGKLFSLSVLDISYTRISAMPKAIDFLTRLQKLDLTHCNELQELPKLPSSLRCLRVHSASLRSVPDLSNLTNLVEMLLSNGFGQALAQPSNPMQTFQLQWVGKLSKLEKLSWGLSNFPISSIELGCLPRLRELTLSSMDNFDSIVVGPQFFNLKNLSILCLHSSPLREIQLDGLELLRNLGVRECEFLERLSVISSSLRKLCKMEVLDCPKLLEIQFPSTMESLEELRVGYCDSLGGLHGLSNLKKLKALGIYQCNGLRVVEGLEELELLGILYFSRRGSLERLTDVSNSKMPNECMIEVWDCMKLSSYEGTYRDYKEMILVRMRMTFNEEDEMEENDRIDCSTGILECICNPLSFFQGRSLRRQTG